jgi:tRNA (adenine-N(1)-)-methyltransferase non-catalytic subunit
MCSRVDLAKYGSFDGDALIGRPYHLCYEILKGGELVPFAPIENAQGGLEDGDIEELSALCHSDQQPTNDAFSDTNSSQQLSHAEIVQLRDAKGKAVISDLIQNSVTFDLKNSFSKAKYIQRKQKKFSRWTRVHPVSSRTLTAHFIERDPGKIMDMRLDTLGQVLNLANVQHGGKFLVYDDTKGLLLGSVLERCCPGGLADQSSLVLAVHEDQQFQPNLLKFFNLTEHQLSCLLDIHLSDCIAEQVGRVEWADRQTDPERLRLYADKIEERRRKFEEKQELRLRARAVLDVKDFDAVLVAVEPDAYSIDTLVSSWLEYLKPGGIMVLYCSSREALNPAFFWALHSACCADVRMTESWLRPYQTAEGRVHPLMTCNGHGGFVLSLIRVLPLQ